MIGHDMLEGTSFDLQIHHDVVMTSSTSIASTKSLLRRLQRRRQICWAVVAAVVAVAVAAVPHKDLPGWRNPETV